MTVSYRTGDLFNQDLPAFGHGVNCSGVMGAGIAREFRRCWPAMYTEYTRLCRDGRLTPGMIHAWRSETGTVVYNLATQDRPGRHAALDAIRQAVTAMLDHAVQHHITAVGLPQLGAGIGGLAWPDVRTVLEQAGAASPVEIVVVSLPVQARATR